MVFTNVTFNIKDGNQPIYGFFMMKYNKSMVVDAHFGLRISSSKEVEARAILPMLKEARSRGISEIMLLSNAKEVVDCINKKADGAINPILLNIKFFESFLFFHQVLTYL